MRFKPWTYGKQYCNDSVCLLRLTRYRTNSFWVKQTDRAGRGLDTSWLLGLYPSLTTPGKMVLDLTTNTSIPDGLQQGGGGHPLISNESGMPYRWSTNDPRIVSGGDHFYTGPKFHIWTPGSKRFISRYNLNIVDTPIWLRLMPRDYYDHDALMLAAVDPRTGLSLASGRIARLTQDGQFYTFSGVDERLPLLTEDGRPVVAICGRRASAS